MRRLISNVLQRVARCFREVPSLCGCPSKGFPLSAAKENEWVTCGAARKRPIEICIMLYSVGTGGHVLNGGEVFHIVSTPGCLTVSRLEGGESTSLSFVFYITIKHFSFHPLSLPIMKLLL